jgi:AcrR family transcriptional regulator
MARRSKDEAEETREQIVTAAIKLFLKDGVSQTTLEKIATEAGYTRGAVYHHFENKATLLAELLKRARPPAEEFFMCMDGLKSQDPLGELKRAMGNALERMLTDKFSRDIHTIFIHNCEFIEKTNPVFEPEHRFAKESLERVCAIMHRAQEMGRMRNDITPEEAAHIALSFCFGIMSISLRNTWLNNNQLTHRNALDIFFKGLRPEAAGLSPSDKSQVT